MVFVVDGALAHPKRDAPRAGAIRRIGFLSGATEAANVGFLQRFQAGMADRHWREGEDYEMLLRYAKGAPNLLPSLAQELVSLQPDVILAPGYLPTQALAAATKTIPIVFMSLIDPVAAGIIRNLNKPGGNLTGFTEASEDLSGKRVQLLKEAIPKLAHLAIVFAPDIPTNPPLAAAAEQVATAMGIRVTRIELRQAIDVDTALRHAKSAGAQAFMVFASAFTQARRGILVKESLDHQVPGTYYDGEFVASGGFMSYATSPEIYRRAATVVDKILRGANPGDLPTEQPTSFELMINLKSAATFGITVPNSLLQRADQLFR